MRQRLCLTEFRIDGSTRDSRRGRRKGEGGGEGGGGGGEFARVSQSERRMVVGS